MEICHILLGWIKLSVTCTHIYIRTFIVDSLQLINIIVAWLTEDGFGLIYLNFFQCRSQSDNELLLQS